MRASRCLLFVVIATIAVAANATTEGMQIPALAIDPDRVVIATPTPSPVLTPVPAEWKAFQEDRFLVKGQATYIAQTKPALSAAYTLPGYNSLSTKTEQSHTATATAYLGARLWRGAEFYLNEEMVIGVPLSDLHGLAAVPNSEIQKASGPTPLFYVPRAFLRQTWGLGGDAEQVTSGLNQLAGATQPDRIVLSVGKLSVMDIFDGNAYAHDGRRDFLNWVNVAGGAYDYAADVRGYSIGATLEYYDDNWAFRAGRFMVPRESNGLQLNFSIANFHGDQLEVERSHELGSLPGKIRALAFRNVALMGRFDDALAYAGQSGGNPDAANVRRPNIKYGYLFGMEQAIVKGLGVYGRLSWNNGQTEMFSYTEVERCASVGVTISGNRWGRESDTVGIAHTANGLSTIHQNYLAAGGTGFLIGDGRLNYRTEQLSELYYSVKVGKETWVTASWQYIANPAYNADRGPVEIFGVRVHTEF
jgi:high affinity Mn2+ porin